MNSEEKGPESMLDQAISDVNNETVSPEVVAAAAGRVWAKLEQERTPLVSCADFQALIPAWREGRLPEARALLVEDHTRECAVCRNHMRSLTAPKVVSIAAKPSRAAAFIRKWAVAAAVLVVSGATAYMAYDRLAVPSGSPASVQAADGGLYRLAGNVQTPVAPGFALDAGQAVRTGEGAHAVVRLRDGSLVEMAERTEFSVSERREGATINLARGSVIVEAAKQRSRHLYVATAECKVAVTGTIFSVNQGMKGSRVAVVEGEVHVDVGKETRILRAGDQTATDPAAAVVSVQDEIAWSRNVDEYIALLHEFAALHKKLEAIPGAAPRTGSALLPLVPEGAVVYVAIPNVGPMMAEAHQIFRQQVQQSEALRQWWTEKMKEPGAEAKFDETIARVRNFSGYLGEEIVIALAPDAKGEIEAPVMLAQVKNAGFRQYLESEIAKVRAESPTSPPVRIVENPAALTPAGDHEMTVLLYNGIVAASPDAARLHRVAALIAQPQAGNFARSEFGSAIAGAYANGVSWLLCADLHSVLARNGKKPAPEALGVGDVRYLIAQRKEVSGKTENRAIVSFANERKGIASWLANPAPMRVLDYVSPDATFVTAAVVKSPSAIVDELFSINGSDAKFLAEVAEFESETHVKIREDLADAFGSEFAVAMDGPLLPEPSWKFVAQVRNAAGLEQAIGRMVEAVNRKIRESGKADVQPVVFGKETVNGRTFYSLRGARKKFEAQFVFEGDILIAAPNRALIDNAIGYQRNGYSVAKSDNFRSQLPQDRHMNFSAVLYHNLGSILGPLAGALPSGKALTAEQKASLQKLAADSGPTVVVAYGAGNRIEVAANGGMFGMDKFLMGAPWLGGMNHRRAPQRQ